MVAGVTVDMVVDGDGRIAALFNWHSCYVLKTHWIDGCDFKHLSDEELRANSLSWVLCFSYLHQR